MAERHTSDSENKKNWRSWRTNKKPFLSFCLTSKQIDKNETHGDKNDHNTHKAYGSLLFTPHPKLNISMARLLHVLCIEVG